MDNKRICFITCVNDMEMYNECVKYLSYLVVPEGYEVENIYIEDADSMAQGYNGAMNSTDAKYKVYLHQDVFIINRNFIFDVLNIFNNNESVGLIGVAGAKTLPTSGIWRESNQKYGKVYDSHSGKMEFLAFNDTKREYESVQAIDGLIMITQYDIPWREDIFDGWDFYDLSQTQEFVKANYEVVIPRQEEPWIIHDNDYKYITNSYDKYRNRFLDVYSKKIFPLVSILIPTYNRPKLFKLALESALKQAYRNIEIIIGDDSTNNETERLVNNEYLNKYSNIKYYHNEINLGQFDNDLKLLDMSNGEFINYLMDDDLFASTKIEKMMDYFINDENEEVSLVTSHREIIDDHGNNKGVFRGTNEIFNKDIIISGVELGNLMLKNNFNFIGEPTTVLFRKSKLHESFGVFNGRRYGCNVDQASWLNLLSNNKAVFIDATLSFFRIHSGQQQQVLSIMIKGFTDYIHQILTCRQKGFLFDDNEYSVALNNCVNLCNKYIINPIKEREKLVDGLSEYEEFMNYYNNLICECKIFESNAQELPLVSILIPAFNQTKYLREALHSAINQTYTNIEIIIGDDSTNNEVYEFILPYLDKYKFITYFKNERKALDYGVSNVEELFKRSNGVYINYLFHDDIFHVEKIEKMMKYYLNTEGITLVTSHRQLIDEDGNYKQDNGATKKIFEKDTLVSGKKLSLTCLKDLTNFIGEPTAVLFKKSYLTDGFGCYNKNSYVNIADMATWFSLLNQGNAVYISESLSYFTQHDSQNSQKLAVYAIGIIEWKNIIDDGYNTGLVNSRNEYKRLISEWFNRYNNIASVNEITNYLSIDTKNRLKDVFINSIDLIFTDVKYEKECVICGNKLDEFLPYTVKIPKSLEIYEIIGSDTDNFSCPNCHSHDRERHIKMFFDELELWSRITNKKILHIAPETYLQQFIEKNNPYEYVRGDLYPSTCNIIKMDITDIGYEDECFDFIICNHVLEHIEDDKKAMHELYRVLKKNGYAVLQTPYSNTLKETYEDKTIKSSTQRLEKFGQEDHVRIYGLDYFERLKDAGFELNIIKNSDLFSKEECKRYGVNYREDLILVYKN